METFSIGYYFDGAVDFQELKYVVMCNNEG